MAGNLGEEAADDGANCKVKAIHLNPVDDRVSLRPAHFVMLSQLRQK